MFGVFFFFKHLLLMGHEAVLFSFASRFVYFCLY